MIIVIDVLRKKIVVSGIWYTISNFIVKGFNFITIPIFTRILTKAQFGDYNNYISFLNIAMVIISLNVEASMCSARYDYSEKLDGYILSILSLSSLSVFIWFVVITYNIEKISNFVSISQQYLYCIIIYLLFYPAVNLYIERCKYRFFYKKAVFVSLIIALGGTVCSIAFVNILSNKLTGRIVGSIIPTVICGMLLYCFFIFKGKHIDIKAWIYAIKICIPYIPHLLSLTILNSMDKVMITKICGSNDTALYSLSYNCGAIITILLTSMNSAFVPWLGEKINAKDYIKVRNMSKIYIAFFSGFAVIVMAMAPEILLLLGGKNYADAKYVMTPVAMGCICQFLYTLFVNIEQFKKRTVGMAMASISAAVINFVLNFYMIPRFGYLAAAYTTLIGYLWLLIVHMIFVYRIGLQEVYDYRYVIKTVIIMMGITMCINYLYAYTAIRYLFIVLYCISFLLIMNKIRMATGEIRYKIIIREKRKNNEIL